MQKPKKILEIKRVLSFISRFFIVLFAGIVISGSFVIIFFNERIGPTYLEGISALSRFLNFLPSVLSITAIVQALALSCVVMLIALVWSHSIAGPLVRFRRCLKDISKGSSPEGPITFRDTDQLHGLAQSLSDMIIAHKDNSVKALTLMVEAEKILNECEALEKEVKVDTGILDEKLKRLDNIYLRIKDVYAVRESGR